MGARPADIEAEIIAFLPNLRRFARSLTGQVADADDLVQLTVERALKRLDQWQRGTRLDSWMMTIMKHAWIDELRSRQRQRRVFRPESEGEQAGADDENFEKRLRAVAIEQAMTHLPPDQRLAVSLVLVQGLSYQEAATVMEVPMGTLTSRLARGRAALEARLNPHNAGRT